MRKSALIVAAALTSLAVVAQADSPNVIADDRAVMDFVGSYSGGNCNGCEWTAAQGWITQDAVERYMAVEAGEALFIPSMRLNSTGGDPFAAMRLGEAFRRDKVDVQVGATIFDAETGDGWSYDAQDDGVCLDACVLAFLGGHWRRAVGDDLFVLNRDALYAAAFPEDVAAAMQAAGIDPETVFTAVLRDYVARMDVDPTLIDRMIEAGRLQIDDELGESLGVFSGVSHGAWRIEPYKAGAIATISTRFTPVDDPEHARHLTLFCRRGADHPAFLLVSGRAVNGDREQLFADMDDVVIAVGDGYRRESAPADVIENLRIDEDGRPYLTLRLNDADIAALRKGGRLSVDAPIWSKWDYDALLVDASADGLRRMLDLVFRNCL